jgi:hypothetical protein
MLSAKNDILTPIHQRAFEYGESFLDISSRQKEENRHYRGDYFSDGGICHGIHYYSIKSDDFAGHVIIYDVAFDILFPYSLRDIEREG